MTRSINEIVGQERGRRWKNRDVNDLISERRHNREGGFMDPKTMPTGMTR